MKKIIYIEKWNYIFLELEELKQLLYCNNIPFEYKDYGNPEIYYPNQENCIYIITCFENKKIISYKNKEEFWKHTYPKVIFKKIKNHFKNTIDN